MSVRRRLVLLAAAAVALAVAGASVATYVLVRAQLRDQVDASLRSLAPDVRSVQAPLAAAGTALPSAAPPAGTERTRPVKRLFLRVPMTSLGEARGFAQVLTADGDVLTSTPGTPTLPVTDAARAVAAGEADEAIADATVDGVHVRVLTVPAPLGAALQVGRPLTELDDALQRLALILALVTLGGVAVAAGLGLVVARAALAPVARLTSAAERLASTGDLTRPLPETGRDEVHRLGAAFNRVLAALRASRDAQRQLVADASHELRTPLTSVRANVELLGRAGELPPAERAAVVDASRRQLEELTVLVGDLVDLARGAGQQDVREDVRLDLLVADAVDRTRAHAPGRELAVAAEPVLVHGSPARLHRAVANLLDNAVKHAPAAAPIEVRVGRRGADAEVAVRDHGPGIAAEDLPLVFDRFYRASSARGRPGSGLGLAIVRQVAEAHGGRAEAQHAEGGGTRVRLVLPAIS